MIPMTKGKYVLASMVIAIVVLLHIQCGGMTSQEILPIQRDTVILLDVSTSMDGRVSREELQRLGNPPHQRHPIYDGYFYIEKRDVLGKAIESVCDEIDKFTYGRLTLIAFQGESFARTSVVPVLRLDADIEDKDDPKKERIRRLLLGGEDPSDKPLWNNDWPGIETAINTMRVGTGTAICSAMEAAVQILSARLEAVRSQNQTLDLPWGYSQDIILITDGEQNQGPEGCFEAISQEMEQLHIMLGPKFFVKRLYWGIQCPDDEIAHALSPEFYTCVPMQGNSARVLLSDVALAPEYNPVDEASLDFSDFYLYLTSEKDDRPLPLGVIRMSIDDFVMEIIYLTQSAAGISELEITRRNLQESGVRVNIASLSGDREPLPEIEVLRGSTAQGKHRFPFRLVVDRDGLQRLYGEILEDIRYRYPGSDIVVRQAKVMGEISLTHLAREDTMESILPLTLDLQRDWIPVWFKYEPPEIGIAAEPDRNASNAVIFTIRPNEAARRIAAGLGEGVAITLQLSGVAETEWTGHPGNVVRLDGSLGEVSVRYEFADVSGGSSARFAARCAHPEVALVGDTDVEFALVEFSAFRQAAGLDVWPGRMKPDGSFLEDTSALTGYCDVRFIAEFAGRIQTDMLVHPDLPAGIEVQLVTDAPIRCPVDIGRSQRFALSIRAESDAALRMLNQIENEVTLRFSPQLEDPFSYPVVAEAQVPVDLQYLEQYVELRFEPSRDEELRPGMTVGELIAYCAETTDEGEARTIGIRYDPGILEIRNASQTADDACLVTASPRGSGKTYAVVVSSTIWEEHPDGGPIAVTLHDESAKLSGLVYSGLTDADRNLSFKILPKPPVQSVLSIAFFWLGVACGGILITAFLSVVVYAYAIDHGGLRQVLYDIQDVHKWMIYAAGGIGGLLILSLSLSLATA